MGSCRRGIGNSTLARAETDSSTANEEKKKKENEEEEEEEEEEFFFPLREGLLGTNCRLHLPLLLFLQE